MKKCLAVSLLAMSMSLFSPTRALASSISVTDLLNAQGVESQAETVVRPQDGKVTVGVWSKNKPTAKLYVTEKPNADGSIRRIPAIGWPKEISNAVVSAPPDTLLGVPETPPKPGDQYWTLSANIPAIVQTGQAGETVLTADVFDVNAEFFDAFTGVQISHVDIESTRPDPSTGEYGLENVFGVLASVRGVGASVDFPVLFGDTNSDGEAGGEGDLLYNLVDLRVYLDGAPSIIDGHLFIIGGTVEGLPGMLFSFTPFTFSTATGFYGTPYTGTAYVGGHITLTAVAVPEPATLTLGLWGLGAVFVVHLLRGSRRNRHM